MNAELTLDTSQLSIAEGVDEIERLLLTTSVLYTEVSDLGANI